MVPCKKPCLSIQASMCASQWLLSIETKSLDYMSIITEIMAWLHNLHEVGFLYKVFETL